jgi:hypothetical protein
VTAGWSATLSFFESLPGKILGFFEALPGDLYNIGASLISKLIDGIKSMAGNAGSLVLHAVESVVPHSVFGIKLWARGGISDVPSTGGLAMLHGKELILPFNDQQRSAELLTGSGLFDNMPDSGGSVVRTPLVGSVPAHTHITNININGPVFGVDDLNRQVIRAIQTMQTNNGRSITARGR